MSAARRAAREDVVTGDGLLDARRAVSAIRVRATRVDAFAARAQTGSASGAVTAAACCAAGSSARCRASDLVRVQTISTARSRCCAHETSRARCRRAARLAADRVAFESAEHRRKGAKQASCARLVGSACAADCGFRCGEIDARVRFRITRLRAQTIRGGARRDARLGGRGADLAARANLIGVVDGAVAVVVDAVADFFCAGMDVRIVVVAVDVGRVRVVEDFAGRRIGVSANRPRVLVVIAERAVVDLAVAVVVEAVADVGGRAFCAAHAVAIFAGRTSAQITAGARESGNRVGHDRFATAERDQQDRNHR